ncbi:MAG: hypothetical protein KKA56_09955 [Gammaproteobacteria bacterium]|jgi:putative oxidoreductase|nr:hypothetical protein [Gammaproteobacteria bacterium]
MKATHNPWLVWGAVATAIAALLHLLIIVGGPDWYRFFGAGEAMAQLAENGDSYPVILTASIAAMLLVWAVYAWAGAGLMPALPLQKTVLALISLIFFGRGLAGLWLVHAPLIASFAELQQRPLFLWLTSLICLALACCYGVGLRKLWRLQQLGLRN